MELIVQPHMGKLTGKYRFVFENLYVATSSQMNPLKKLDWNVTDELCNITP